MMRLLRRTALHEEPKWRVALPCDREIEMMRLPRRTALHAGRAWPLVFF
jgi:hypothetical protein